MVSHGVRAKLEGQRARKGLINQGVRSVSSAIGLT